MIVFKYATQVRIFFDNGKQKVLEHIKTQEQNGNMVVYEDYNGKQYLIMLEKVNMIEMECES